MKKHPINLIQKGIVIIGVVVAFNGLLPAVYAQSSKMLIAQKSAEDFLDQEIDKESDLLYQGAEKFNRQDYRGAIADFNQAIRLKPNDAQPYYNRGLARSKLGEFKGAISDYNQALREDPNYAEAYLSRGQTLARLGNFQAARIDLNQAIRLKSNYASAYYSRGLVRFALEDNKEGATADLQLAADLFLMQGSKEDHQRVIDTIRKLNNLQAQ